MRWLVKDALLQDREDDRKTVETVDRKTVSVYAFAPTKIANMAFERWYDRNVPRTFNFIMKYDPVAQVSATIATATSPIPSHAACPAACRAPVDGVSVDAPAGRADRDHREEDRQAAVAHLPLH